MASKVISGDIPKIEQPMPWQTVGGPVAPSRYSLQYNTPPPSDRQVSNGEEQMQAQRALAEAERGRLVTEGRKEGWSEGEAAGRRAAQAELQPVLQKLASSIQQVLELPGRLRAQAETQLVELAMAIAQRILQRELTVDPTAITGLVRVGLDKVRVQDVQRVRVCPDHQAAIKEWLTRFGAENVEVSADPTLERGGVILETSRGKLDVSIGTQLREIERGFTDRMRGQGY
jgi:flagellar assembly protein FliH